ncbi:MAG: DUF2071 domain-containing protein [Acidobacteriota bacterium]|nr:DUF2071 domain-containing protein [Acidobacteriota bacterium]
MFYLPSRQPDPGFDLISRLPFLTARWRHLAMLNYEIDPEALAPDLPAGTEPDTWHGRAFVSMVGFLFLETRVVGLPLLFHQEFEEVNLRFYVRRKAGAEWRRGVFFVREIVPSPAVALAARLLYGERYVALPTRHRVQEDEADGSCRASYGWRFQGRENRLEVAVSGPPRIPSFGSEEDFIASQAWGYSRRGPSRTLEYRVEHPPWTVRSASESLLDCDVARLYGDRFAEALRAPPSSAFLAEGSLVKVFAGAAIAL